MASNSATDDLSVNEHSSVSVALRNKLILEAISTFLSLKDVKHFRLVNLQWNQISVPVIRQKCGYINPSDKKSKMFLQYLKSAFPDKFNSDFDAQIFINSLSDNDLQNHMVQSLLNLSSLIQISSGFPCSKFKLGANIINKPSDDVTIQTFFQIVSTFITELCLEKKSSKASIFHQNPSNTLVFSNLKVLEIKFVGRWSNQIGMLGNTAITKDLRFFLMIIENAPNLDTLILESCDSAEFITYFLNWMNNRILKNIQNLKLCGQLEDNHFTKLAKIELNLKSLSLTILMLYHCHQLNPESLVSFINSQRSNLEQLHIEGLKTKEAVVFCCMPKLTVLEIDVSSAGCDVSFLNINLAKLFPKLQELTLIDKHPNLKHLFNSKPLESVVKLSLPNDLDDSELIPVIASVFPKVKTLKIPAHLDLLRAVDREMGNVEELCLSGGSDEDSFRVLTGYTKNALIEKNTDATANTLAILNNVKILRLEYISVTDSMCVYGLIKLRSLKCLDLWDNTGSEVSIPVLNRMRRKLTVFLRDNCIILENKSDLVNCM